MLKGVKFTRSSFCVKYFTRLISTPGFYRHFNDWLNTIYTAAENPTGGEVDLTAGRMLKLISVVVSWVIKDCNAGERPLLDSGAAPDLAFLKG